MNESQQRRERVVVVGGGFGGLRAARGLARAAVDVTLIDRRNFHLFQPLLYQVATGSLSPANIAAPLRALLRRQANAEVLLAEVVDIDVQARQLRLVHGTLAYDTLVVAAGSTFNYFGHDAWGEIAPGLKTVEDATRIRARVLTAFEEAEREADPERRRAWLTFVIVGGGPTGVELAGSLIDMARRTLRHDFRAFDPASARIVLVEGQEKVLASYADPLPDRARQALARSGIEIHSQTLVIDVRPDGVTLSSRGEQHEIHANTIIWTAGVKASPLAARLAHAAGTQTDRSGRIVVEPDLTMPGHPEIFVIGDLANFSHQDGHPLPGLAPVAMQQGQYVARAIARRLTGRPPAPPFHYRDKGTMAVIGRHRAVADLWGVRLSGAVAWVLWLFVHLMFLVQFQNRVLVLVQWAWNYFTRSRAACLITGPGSTADPAGSGPGDQTSG